MSSWIDEFLAQFVRVEELANARAELVSHMTEMVLSGHNELWKRVADIEKIHVSIPVDYTPHKQTVTLPHEDTRGKVYSVVAVPIDYLEQAFEQARTAIRVVK